MPVQGLSDRGSVDPRFMEIGRARKGAPKTENQPGRDLSYFRYVPDSRHQESAAVFEQIYGAEPTHLQVYFPFDTMERVFSSWREAYGQNRLCKLRCDGERWHDWIKGDRHYHSGAGQECDLPYRDSENRCPKCPCQYVGRLSIILEPMWEAGQIGLVTVITSSVNDIANLAAKLVQWEPLTNKPFTLWREPTRIGVPIKGKRAAKDSDLLHLELSKERILLEFREAQRQSLARLTAPADQAQIVAPVGELPFDEPPVDYDGEMIGDDEFLREVDYSGHPPDPTTREELLEVQEAEAAPPSSVELVPAPDGLTHKNIVEKALILDGYDNVGQVKDALLAVVGKGWNRNTEWSKTLAWSNLQVHAAAPKEA